jgi:hypothetical protein
LEEEEVCLIGIKEKVGEKRSTVCTHEYADCLLKNTSTPNIANMMSRHIKGVGPTHKKEWPT